MAFVMKPSCSLSLKRQDLALSREEIPERVIVVLVEGCVNERVEEWVGVTQPKKDTLPYWWYIAGAQRRDEFGEKEGDPAEDEHSDEDAHHQSRSFLFLFSPRLAVGLESHCGVTHGKHHLRLLSWGLFYLKRDRKQTMSLELLQLFWVNSINSIETNVTYWSRT